MNQLLSRREFLSCAAAGLAAGAVVAWFPALLETPFNHQVDEDFKFRNGVYVAGEDQEFDVGRKFLRAAVNERAFLATLEAAAKATGMEKRISLFFKSHPLRVSLHRAPFGATAAYFPSDLAKRPELQISTYSLKEYYRSQISQNPLEIKLSNETVTHELRHVWQDATGWVRPLTKFVDASMSVTLFSSYVLARSKVIPEGVIDSKRLAGEILLSSIVLGGIYELKNFLSPAEIDAYFQDGKILDLPGVSEFRGKFFSFTEV